MHDCVLYNNFRFLLQEKFTNYLFFSLYSSSQSAKYSNVDRPKESEQTVSNSSSSSPRGGHALDNYRQSNVEGTDDIQSGNEEQSDGIMIEQLAGIQGAIDAMENTEVNDDEDSLSLLMNVLESDDLSTVLNDMPWNLM
jgi:hypothetical protein